MQRTSLFSYMHSVKARIFPAYPHSFHYFRYSSSSLLLLEATLWLSRHHLKTYSNEKLTDGPYHERIRLQRLHEKPLLWWLGRCFNNGSDPMALGGILRGLSASVLTDPFERASLRGAFFMPEFLHGVFLLPFAPFPPFSDMFSPSCMHLPWHSRRVFDSLWSMGMSPCRPVPVLPHRWYPLRHRPVFL